MPFQQCAAHTLVPLALAAGRAGGPSTCIRHAPGVDAGDDQTLSHIRLSGMGGAGPIGLAFRQPAVSRRPGREPLGVGSLEDAECADLPGNFHIYAASRIRNRYGNHQYSVGMHNVDPSNRPEWVPVRAGSASNQVI